jgi:transcriptional regulator with XRE-family HTH domain
MTLADKQVEMKLRYKEKHSRILALPEKPAKKHKRDIPFEDFSGLEKRELIARLQDKEFRRRFNEWQIRYAISVQVKALRLKHGWSLKTLAANSGLAYTTIYRIENLLRYKWLPRVESLLALARVFDVALIVRFDSWSRMLRHWFVFTPTALLSFDEVIEEMELKAWAEHEGTTPPALPDLEGEG